MRWMWIALVAWASPVLAQDSGALSLEQALRTAREREPQIRQAHAATEAAKARADAARAGLLPQLTGTASYQRTTANVVQRPGFVRPSSTTKSGTTGAGTGTSAQPTRKPTDMVNFYQFGVTANQLVYDFGAQHGTFRAAKESARAQAESERSSLLAVELGVRTSYFRARAQKALVLVAQKAVENQAAHLRQIEAFVEVGARPAIDLAQVRTDLANARVQLIQAEGNYEAAKAELNRAMGVERSTSYEVGEDTLAPLADEDAATDVLLADALRTRPELAALSRQARALALRERAAKGAYGPVLSLTGSFTDIGIDLGNLGWNWSAGAALNWPLLQGGLTRANVHEARANIASLRAEADALRQQVRLELEQARLAVRSAKAVVEAADEAQRFARERLTLAEGRYQAGVGNVIELGDAQLALTSAEAQRVSAEYELAAARAQLLHALGRSQ